jgi:hypothetical protein
MKNDEKDSQRNKQQLLSELPILNSSSSESFIAANSSPAQQQL